MDKKQLMTVVIGTLIVGFLISFPILLFKGRKMVTPIPEESGVKVIFVSPKPSPTEEATSSATVTPKKKEPTATPKPKLTATPAPQEKEPTATPTPKKPTATSTEEPTATPTPEE